MIVENESHCDFVKLREMLIRTNMEDLREKTHEKHYELYRKMRLEQVRFKLMNHCAFIKLIFTYFIDGFQRCR